jgi:hypothetical protein
MAYWLVRIIVLMMIFNAAPLGAETEASDLLVRLRSSRVEESSIIPASEIAQVELLFARGLDRPMAAGTLHAWAEHGFATESIRLQGDPCHLLFEKPDARLGRGLFLLCPTRSQGSILLIPHGFHDRFTAEIGVLLAEEGRFRAVAWNTTPRQPTEDDDSEIVNQDAVLEIETENYFTGLARAVSVLGLPGPMIQLHGFAPYLRSTEAGRSARAILSSGSNDPHRSTLDAASCLEHELGERLLVYPTEVSELGGTQNQIAAVLRGWGRRDFLHIELSFALRKKLLEDSDTRRSLIGCVEGQLR